MKKFISFISELNLPNKLTLMRIVLVPVYLWLLAMNMNWLALAVFAISLWLTRYVSLSSILGASAFAVSFAIMHWQKHFAVAVGIFLVLLIIFMHRSNIARLIKGTEKKATFSKFRKQK